MKLIVDPYLTQRALWLQVGRRILANSMSSPSASGLPVLFVATRKGIADLSQQLPSCHSSSLRWGVTVCGTFCQQSLFFQSEFEIKNSIKRALEHIGDIPTPQCSCAGRKDYVC